MESYIPLMLLCFSCVSFFWHLHSGKNPLKPVEAWMLKKIQGWKQGRVCAQGTTALIKLNILKRRGRNSYLQVEFFSVFTTLTLGLGSAMRCLTEKHYGIIRSSLETHLKEKHFLELIKCYIFPFHHPFSIKRCDFRHSFYLEDV